MTIAALVSWNLTKYQGEYYTLNVHYAYIRYLSTAFDKVVLISSVRSSSLLSKEFEYYSLGTFPNVTIVELPEVTSSARALRNISHYYIAIKKTAKKVDLFYSRVPDPFSWMPRLLGRKPTIMHFVGDTMDATKYNENWSSIKKAIMIAGYMPEWYLTLWAARKSRVYCNGYHLVERLNKHGIKASAVISSIVRADDLPVTLSSLPIESNRIHILFLSYIRFAKGINCLMDLITKLQQAAINYQFDIIGDGEMLPELRDFVTVNNLSDSVILHGMINDRHRINHLMHNSDLFFFSSLSEGSPRVIVEAASQGIPILSTPVGALPYTFEDQKSIRFFPYNDSDSALKIIKEYLKDPTPFINQREAAFSLVKNNYTIEKFLSKVFNYE